MTPPGSGLCKPEISSLFMMTANPVSTIKLIVGLGNPGTHYADTRHNAGAWYVQRLAKQYLIALKPQPRFGAQVGQLLFDHQPITLLIPTTFMNLSGDTVAQFAHFYRIQPQEILIAHDDLDLAVGRVKWKLGGGHAGHNGLKDIINKLHHCRDFYRLRIGIGHPGSKSQVVNFVLEEPPADEQQLINQAIDQALKTTELLLQQGISQAMQLLQSHSKGSKRSLTQPKRLQ
jgi:peptidyl-tRNA hydrolase, PTH1 family